MSNPIPKLKNKWFTLYLLVSSADKFCNDLGRRSERQNVGPNLYLNYSTLWWYSLIFFRKSWFLNNQQMPKIQLIRLRRMWVLIRFLQEPTIFVQLKIAINYKGVST